MTQKKIFKWIKRIFINKATIVILVVSILSCYLSIRFQLKIHNNMLLFGLIISFPLVFALQSAFKRRDRALEYMSIFSSSLLTVSEAFQQSNKLSRQNRHTIQDIIEKLQIDLFNYLQSGNDDPVKVLSSFSQVSSFIILSRDEIDDRLKYRVGRYMKDVYDSARYLVAIKNHGTMVGTRMLSYIFLTIFPLIQAQFLLNTFGDQFPEWMIYFISIITSVTLGALILIQEQLEDPFDEDGLDDIQFDKFSIIRKN